MDQTKVLGIDIGGTGIKGGIVDIITGEMLTERLKVATPQPATPRAVARAVKELVELHQYTGGLVGCGFPAIIKNGVALTAANVDKDWIGTDVETLLSDAIDMPVKALNDADAAGICEVKYGAGKDVKGVVLLLTLGTGIGTALFVDGILVPNTELGHVQLNGIVAEKYTAGKIKKNEDLSYKEWGNRLDEYLDHIERIMCPDLIVLGGGISRKFEKYDQQLTTKVPVVPAMYENKAGAIGAAMYAYDSLKVTV